MSEYEAINESRRRVLRSAGLVAGGAAVATVLPAAVAAASDDDDNDDAVTLDVACDNATFTLAVPEPRVTEFPVGEGFPPQGSTFYVEGALFHGGTIPIGGSNWDYAGNLSHAIGHWMCYGWFVHTAARFDPHIVSNHSYLLDRISQQEPFPHNQMQSHGLEGTFGGAVAHRSVIGGTGRYNGASGTVRQTVIGTNSTRDDFDFEGLNFRFVFEDS